MSKLKVAVLMGGTSAEREVSLWTGQQILNALDPAKYRVYALDTQSGQRMLPVGQDELQQLVAADGRTQIEALTQLAQVDRSTRPDVVIIALHGPGGEDGTVQGMLEVLGIPYTGSGVLSSALAMDKAMCKRVLETVGVLLPNQTVVRRGHEDTIDPRDVRYPSIVKPNRQGSTIGTTRVYHPQQLMPALADAFEHDTVALIEDYIEGVEITVPILGNDDLEVLPIVEIVPSSGFYDYHDKYTPGATDEICPARLKPDVATAAREIAQTCHRTLQCRGVSRTDMIVDAGDTIYTLEVNTIPGMAPTSLLPRSASVAGYRFSEVMDRLIELALERG